MDDAQIFQIIAIFYISVSAGIILNPGYYKNFLRSFYNEPVAVFVSGLIAVTVGYLIIRHHNLWQLSSSVIITIIGWLAFLKGIFIIAMPQLFIEIARTRLKTDKLLYFQALIGFVVGIIFLLLSL